MIYEPVYIESGYLAIHVGDMLAFEPNAYTGEVNPHDIWPPGLTPDIFHFFYTRYAHTPFGIEILFRWCLNTYNVSVTNNVPQVELLSSSYDYDFGNFSASGSLYSNYTNEMYLKSPGDTSTRYLVTGISQSTMYRSMNDSLVGKNYINPGYKVNSGYWLFDSTIHDYRLNQSQYETSKELDQARWDRMWNVSQNIAASLTNFILNEDIEGTAWEMEPYVSIQWKWLSRLAAQIGLSNVVLIFSIIATARSGLSIMKASPLPAFFAIPAEEKLKLYARASITSDTCTEKMVQASGVAGRLREDGKLWKLE
ncbi:hypothetical protein LIA77_11716 [Sarocladium implicatum]|nr:hypothetical protein LIA77_11716 [Sarocladium implicatum]